jgi:hypothetical protein
MKKFRGFKPSSVLSAPLINTHFQVGVATAELNPKRSNGFSLASSAIAPVRQAAVAWTYVRIAEEEYVVRSETLPRNR